MVPLWHPLRLRLVALAGWIDQQRRDVIDYLQEENRVLREQPEFRRLRFTNDRRIREFVQHYHHERNHQGMNNRLLFPVDRMAHGAGPIKCRTRLGGLLKYTTDPPPPRRRVPPSRDKRPISQLMRPLTAVDGPWAIDSPALRR